MFDSYKRLSYNSVEVRQMNKNEYIAIIGDIYDSRLLVDRKKVQKNLLNVLDSINKKY